MLTKNNESAEVINAALCGHENVEPQTFEAVLVEAAPDKKICGTYSNTDATDRGS